MFHHYCKSKAGHVEGVDDSFQTDPALLLQQRSPRRVSPFFVLSNSLSHKRDGKVLNKQKADYFASLVLVSNKALHSTAQNSRRK